MTGSSDVPRATAALPPQDAPASGAAGLGLPLLLTLALLTAVSPIATDLYLPGFPEMARDLGTDATGAQLTLTTFFVGLAAGQLVMGPLSDRFGRRGPLLLSSAVCVAAGVLAVWAPDLAILAAARFLQGLTGSGGLVIGRAVIADLVSGPRAAKAFTLMMTVGGVAPVLAPLGGSLLVGPLGWRGVLGVLAGLCLVMFVAVLASVPETRPREVRQAAAIPFGQAFRRVVTNRGFLAYTATFTFAFGTMMAYIAASPFIYQTITGLGEIGYGLMFGVNAGGMIAAGFVASRLVERVPPRRLILVAVSTELVGAATFAVLAATGAPVWTYAVAIFVAVLPVGAAMGTCAGLAMSEIREVAGTGSAVLGCCQHSLGAVVAPLVGLGGSGSALVPALVMTGSALVAVTVAATRLRA